MTKKRIYFGKEAKKGIYEGINKLANAVKSTLGPSGKYVAISNQVGSAHITKDGVTVAKAIDLEDQLENEGAQLVKNVSLKTNETAGDGTTTATVLAQSLLYNSTKLISENTNTNEFKKGMIEGLNNVLDFIEKNKETVDSEQKIKNIATISSGEEEIGEVIKEAVSKVGNEGIINIEEGNNFKTEMKFTTGMRFERGYESPYFATDSKTRKAELNDPYILIYDKPIMQIEPLVNILDTCVKESKTLLIISDQVSHEALSTLILNKQKNILNVCAVRTPSFGEDRKEFLQDLAILTGGTYVSDEMGYKLEETTIDMLGRAKKVVVDMNETSIIGGYGNKEKIKERIEELNAQIKNLSEEYMKAPIKKRLSKLDNGVATIKVGGSTETEMLERKDRIEDAYYATKAAIEDGVIIGGGALLVKAYSNLIFTSNEKENTDFENGKHCVYTSLVSPITEILENLYYDTDRIQKVIMEIIEKDSDNKLFYGYDAKNETFCNLKENGIIDPAKVTKEALKNSVSIISTLINTDSIIVDVIPEGYDMVIDKPF